MDNVITSHIRSINQERKDRYTYKNSISVSKCIGYLHPEFDTIGTAKNMVEKYYNVEGHKYYHMTVEEIIALWEDKRNKALTRGKLYDSLVEQILEIRDPIKLKEWKTKHNYESNAFIQLAYKGLINVLTFLNERKYVCIGTEIQMFVEDRNNPANIVNGRCDALFYSNLTNRYLIIDWKTNEEIRIKGYNSLYGPAAFYQDTDYYKYMFQLSFYKKALAETYKLAIDDNIDIMIAQMGHNDVLGYTLYSPAMGNYRYDATLMDMIIQYCYLKHNLK